MGFVQMSSLRGRKLYSSKFVSQHLSSGNQQVVSLLSNLQSQKVWHVNLERDEHNVYLAEGWEDFVKAHGLAPGYNVTFIYEGNNIFSTKVYALDRCLKEYGNRRIYGRQDVVEHHQPNNQPNNLQGNTSENMPSSSGPVSPPSQLPPPSALPSSSGPVSPPSQLPPPSALPVALPVSHLSQVHQFQREITHSEIRLKSIYIPAGFYHSNETFLMSVSVLKDSLGRNWPVVLHEDHGRHYLRCGGFFHLNDVKEYDVCLFQLESPQVMLGWKL